MSAPAVGSVGMQAAALNEPVELAQIQNRTRAPFASVSKIFAIAI